MSKSIAFLSGAWVIQSDVRLRRLKCWLTTPAKSDSETLAHHPARCVLRVISPEGIARRCWSRQTQGECLGKTSFLTRGSRPVYCPSVNGSEQPSGELPIGCFHTTHWTDVLAAGAEDSSEANEALARLCQTYWLPIYAFIRKRGHGPQQAQDLTQEFFAGFLEKRRVAQAARDRGRFRSFLMTSVENFLRNAHDRSQAQKRGGGRSLISLDNQDAEALYLEARSDDADPAAAFEQRWASTLLQTVLRRLQDEFVTGGRADLFDALQTHLWGDADSTSYPLLAERFAMTVANVKTTAHRLRARYRELLREEIARTVSHPGEIDDEIRHLMRVVSQ